MYDILVPTFLVKNVYIDVKRDIAMHVCIYLLFITFRLYEKNVCRGVFRPILAKRDKCLLTLSRVETFSCKPGIKKLPYKQPLIRSLIKSLTKTLIRIVYKDSYNKDSFWLIMKTHYLIIKTLFIYLYLSSGSRSFYCCFLRIPTELQCSTRASISYSETLSSQRGWLYQRSGRINEVVVVSTGWWSYQRGGGRINGVVVVLTRWWLYQRGGGRINGVVVVSTGWWSY